MEQLLNWLGDSYLFYNELEEIDQTHVDDVAGDDNGEDLRYEYQVFSISLIEKFHLLKKI